MKKSTFTAGQFLRMKFCKAEVEDDQVRLSGRANSTGLAKYIYPKETEIGKPKNLSELPFLIFHQITQLRWSKECIFKGQARELV